MRVVVVRLREFSPHGTTMIKQDLTSDAGSACSTLDFFLSILSIYHLLREQMEVIPALHARWLRSLSFSVMCCGEPSPQPAGILPQTRLERESIRRMESIPVRLRVIVSRNQQPKDPLEGSFRSLQL
jgi:hypothetical protein